MKILYLEAVDPEERKLRGRKIKNAEGRYEWMSKQAYKQAKIVADKAPAGPAGDKHRQAAADLKKLGYYYFAAGGHAKWMAKHINNFGSNKKRGLLDQIKHPDTGESIGHLLFGDTDKLYARDFGRVKRDLKPPFKRVEVPKDESVDPEERKLRLRKVAKRIPILKKARDMALAHAGSGAAFQTASHKLKKAKAILARDKDSYRTSSRHQKSWSAQIKPAAKTPEMARTTLSGADPEERSLRVHRLRDYGKLMNRVAHNSMRFDNNFDKAMRQSKESNRAYAIAQAYSGQDPRYTAFYKSSPRVVPKGRVQDKPLRARIMDVLAKKGAGIVHKNIDKEQRAKRIEKLVNLGTRSRLAHDAYLRGDEDAAKRLGIAGKRKTWIKGDTEPKMSLDYTNDAERAHTIAAKFLTRKSGKAKFQRVISRLKKGQASAGLEDRKTWHNPIKDKLGVRTENEMQGMDPIPYGPEFCHGCNVKLKDKKGKYSHDSLIFKHVSHPQGYCPSCAKALISEPVTRSGRNIKW